MSVLQIHLLGTVRLSYDDRPPAGKVTRAVQGLLAYLVLHRDRTHSRETLGDLFWGDQRGDRARGSLSTTLWRLRQVLEPPGVGRGTYLLTSASGEVGFNRESDHWLDVAILEGQAQRVLRQPPDVARIPDVGSLERALDLYSGDLLEAFYDEWALSERERLRVAYLGSLARLMRHHADAAAYEEALACGRQILALDPLREEIHRDMMRLYARSGRRALALQQYASCRETLVRELDIEPMAETRALHARIAQGTDDVAGAPPAAAGSSPLALTVETVAAALRAVDRAREQLQDALRALEVAGLSRSSRPAPACGGESRRAYRVRVRPR
jgi:DNA-binding SARP family transcriptional activator